MKTIAVLFLFVLVSCTLLYSYDIQQISITFIDASRNNRQIPTQIFIPIDNEVSVTTLNRNESFPFIVFGHGWLQSYSVYQSVWEDIVPQGWIMAFPTTEGGLFPNHQNFALDLAFLSFAIPAAGQDPESPLFDLVEPLSIVMGHSMGGGCSIMAASYANDFTAMVTFAAASSDAALDAAIEVEIPSLTLAGTSDWITPPGSHQIPLYQNLASIYKAYVSFNGVDHSGIYNNNTVFELIEQWLNFFTTDDLAYITEMEDLLEMYEADQILTYGIEVTLLPPQDVDAEILEDMITISWEKVLFAEYYVVEAATDINGQFSDVSSGQGIFTESSDRVSWTTDLDFNESLMFFRVKAGR